LTKKNLCYDDLIETARRYGVAENPLFTSAAYRYSEMMKTIAELREQIEKTGVSILHTNVRGEDNMDVNPLVPQLPKYVDSANKTLSTMLDVITRLGTVTNDTQKFGDMDE